MKPYYGASNVEIKSWSRLPQMLCTMTEDRTLAGGSCSVMPFLRGSEVGDVLARFVPRKGRDRRYTMYTKMCLGGRGRFDFGKPALDDAEVGIENDYARLGKG